MRGEGIQDTRLIGRAVMPLLCAVCFVLAHREWSLFVSNQNTKLLHSFAWAMPDRFAADWQAGTATGLPVFNAIGWAVLKLFGPLAFHPLAWALLALLALSLWGVATLAAGPAARGAAARLTLAAALVCLAAPSLKWLWHGVALQYLTHGYFQPADFGVAMILGLVLAQTGRRGAALLVALPALVHPAYVLPGAVLLATLFLPGTPRRPGWKETALAVICLAAPVLDIAWRFAPPDPETGRRAAEILAFTRIPHHSDPALWVDRWALVKLALALTAIAVAPRGPIRHALVALTLVALVGTVWVTLTGDARVALAAPWRTSVIVMPVALAVLLGRAVALAAKAPRTQWTLAAPALLAAVLFTAQGIARHAAQPTYRPLPDHYAFIRDSFQPGAIHLTHPKAADFRLATRSAQYVSWKSHPYRADEVFEWHRRITEARAVFAPVDTSYNCARLDALGAEGVTHLVLDHARHSAGLPPAFACPNLTPAFEGQDGAIFTLSADTAPRLAHRTP